MQSVESLLAELRALDEHPRIEAKRASQAGASMKPKRMTPPVVAYLPPQLLQEFVLSSQRGQEHQRHGLLQAPLHLPALARSS